MLKTIFDFFIKRYSLLKSDKFYFYSCIIFLLLGSLHIAYYFQDTTIRQPVVRCVFCYVIALVVFLFSRKGFAIVLLLFAFTLMYWNTFYNYTSFLFLILSVHLYPELKQKVIPVYALNGFIAFAVKGYAVYAVGIHALYCVFFYLCVKYTIQPKLPPKLILEKDERNILAELAKGKLQKEIELFSQNTITAKLRKARERNLCNTTQELLHRFIAENQSQNNHNDNRS